MRDTRFMRRVITNCAIAILMLVFGPGLLVAQTAGAGSITGTVMDANHAVIPGATVHVTNVDTGLVREDATNSAGIYTVPFLQPGHYTLEAKASGFGAVVEKGLTLQVGETLTLDLSLTVKAEVTTVEVTAGGQLLDTEKTEVSQVIDQQLISNLPVNGRNWSDFVLLTPNVVQDGGSGLVSFHGISGLYNQNYVDGANNNQMLFSEARGRASGAPYVYSLDSIKEFQTEAATYSAEFGQAAGGQVNAITKSGSNHFHGDAFYQLRYPELNALDPYSKWQALHNHGNKFLLTQPIHQQQDFGASVGGPIIKDKLFFFATGEGFRRVGRVLYYETNANITTTPTGLYGDSSNISPNQCPQLLNSSGHPTGTPAITNAQCLAAINFLLNMTGATSAPPSRYARELLFFPRIDYQLNAKNLIYANFNYANFDQTNGYSPNPTYSNSSVSTNGPTSYHERFAIAHWTSTITNTAVNDLRFQYGRDLETAGANAPGPSIGVGPVTYGMPNALPRIAEPDEHRIQVTDVFSKEFGRHTLKFGGDVNIVHEVMINLFQGGGIYNYSSATMTTQFQQWAVDAFAGQPGDVDPYAGSHYNTFVQTVDAINPISTGKAGNDDFWMKMYDGFVEDTWKARRNLTFNLGVRYDFQQTPNSPHPNTSSPIAAEYSQTIKNVETRIQPRIGFAWTPFSGTVVRGGYGMFGALNQGSTYYAMRVENGVYQINFNYSGKGPTCPAGAPLGYTGCANAALHFPNVPFAVPGPSLSGALYPTGGDAPAVVGGSGSASISFHGLSPNFVPPLSHEFEFAIEQQLPWKSSLSVGYVGSRATNLPVFLDANLVGQKPSGLRSFEVQDKYGHASEITVPYYKATDRINTALTSLNTGFSIADSWYHSLAVTFHKPFDHGIELIFNYTWSKALDDDQVAGAFGTFYGGNTVLDPNNLMGEYGLSDLDVRQRFVGIMTWTPKFKVSNPIARYALNGFTFSGEATEMTGQPIAAGMSGTVSVPSGHPAAADGNIYGGAMSSSSGAATTGRPPNIRRNSQVGPGLNDLDFRITRDFAIREWGKFEIIGEAFNLSNGQINTNVNSTYASYFAPGKSVPQPGGGSSTCPTSVGVPAGSFFSGCIAPYAPTAAYQNFGKVSGTNNLLYGPRQLQVSAKFVF